MALSHLKTAGLLLALIALAAPIAAGAQPSSEKDSSRRNGDRDKDDRRGDCKPLEREGRQPSISILSPVNRSNLADEQVFVSGTFSGPANTGVTVNGVASFTDGHFFYANNVPLAKGRNTIEAVATTPEGKHAESRVVIEATGTLVLQLSTTPDSGLNKLSATFTFVFFTSTPIRSIAMDFDGDGVVDISSANPASALQFTYSNPGLYVAKLRLTDAKGDTYERVFAVQVLDASAHDRLMNAALICGNVERALKSIAIRSRDEYLPIFRALRDRFSAIIRSYSPLQQSTLAVT